MRKDGETFGRTYVHRGGGQQEEDKGRFLGICEKNIVVFH